MWPWLLLELLFNLNAATLPSGRPSVLSDDGALGSPRSAVGPNLAS